MVLGGQPASIRGGRETADGGKRAFAPRRWTEVWKSRGRGGDNLWISGG